MCSEWQSEVEKSTAGFRQAASGWCFGLVWEGKRDDQSCHLWITPTIQVLCFQLWYILFKKKNFRRGMPVGLWEHLLV